MTTYKLCSLIKKELSWKSITKIYLGKLPSDWKLSKTLSRNLLDQRRNHNGNDKTLCTKFKWKRQHVKKYVGCRKIGFTRKGIAVHAYVGEKRSKISNVSFYWNKLEKEDQDKLNRREEIKIRGNSMGEKNIF